MRRVLFFNFCCVLMVFVCLVGCSWIYETYVLYYVPQWDMYIKLTGAKQGEHRVYFSNNRFDLHKQDINNIDYVVMNDDYLDGYWNFLIVNQASPDTLFVMSKKYNSVSIPMKTITLQSMSHFRTDGAYFKCENGYFGFYIFKGEKGVQLIELSEKENGWELKEVYRNCLWL